MDKVFEYLVDRPDGAAAEEIAREALGLKGAVGVVADRVVKAAAEADPRIVTDAKGQWVVCAGPQEQTLRRCRYLVTVCRVNEDGTVAVSVARITFDGNTSTESCLISAVRSEAAARELDRFWGLAEGCIPAGFRYATVRGIVNPISRLQLGRESLHEGLCLSRLARRCFPQQKIRSCSDIAAALRMPYVESDDPEASGRQQANLLLGLLECCEARSLTTVDAVRSDLQPTVSAVDFEAFAFDEDYLDELPACPGVYVMRDAAGKVIYVGKSVNLRDRVKTYFAKRSEREEKTLKILDRIWTVEIEKVGSDLEALMLEARLIQATRPEFNTQQAIHERSASITKRGPFVVILPSSDSGSVELFCVRSDREIHQERVRKDLTDWPDRSSHVHGYFGGAGAETDAVEQAAHLILQGWIQQHADKVNLIDVGDAGPANNLNRLLEEHIHAADDDAWEKVWRV